MLWAVAVGGGHCLAAGAYLLVHRVREFDLHVAAAGTDEGRVEEALVVGGQEDDGAARVGDAVERVEQPREGHVARAVAALAVVAEERVDVFEGDDCLCGHGAHGHTEVGVLELGVGEGGHTHRAVEVRGHRADERALATARRPVQQEGALVRDACARRADAADDQRRPCESACVRARVRARVRERRERERG